MFKSENIQCIKSVTREGGRLWAYMEYNVGDIFELRFPNNPNWFPVNYRRPPIGELMVLFQTLLPKEGLPGGWYVTHLITPVDDQPSFDNDPLRPHKRFMCVVGKCDPAYLVPADWSFFKANRGPVCDINTIARKYGHDFTLIEKQQFFWNLFNKINPALRDSIRSIVNDPTLIEEDDDLFAEEGREQFGLRLHKYYERDRKIIAEAKNRAIKENRLRCEVCKFDFSAIYPQLGSGFIECHHNLPIATGGIRQTRVEDLALVCANCHRMLHKKLDGKYLSVTELRERFFAT